MGSFYSDNDDLQFYVKKGIDWAPLIEFTERNTQSPEALSGEDATEFYGDIISLIGDFVAERVAPFAAEIDREGVKLVDGEVVSPAKLDAMFEEIKGLELHGMCLPRELGGQNCPLLLFNLSTEIFGRADTSIMAHHSFHAGIAMAMLVFSILEGSTEFDKASGAILKTRFAEQIEEIRVGDAWGCMDITEPNAGSDMGALAATGEQDEDGRWYVTGQKIFITSGHGKYHFVIARTEPAKADDDLAAGLTGLSMFMVPTYEETDSGERNRIVRMDRLEEKLGHHGSATASLTFERAPAELIGRRKQGFKHMLTLMNAARVGVGFECIGLCEAAFRLAREYAADRKSMGKTIDQHEMIADYLDEMELDILALRALAVTGAYHDELAQKINIGLKSGLFTDEDEITARRRSQRRHQKKARRVTPLLKFLAAEKAVEMSRRCVQIHGGVGYTREYGAEKLLRDAMVMPIYEGTSQIQALMAMKDTLVAAMRNPRRFAARLAEARWKAASARDPHERSVAKVQSLSLRAQQHLLTRTAADKYRSLKGKPLTEWPERFMKNWDPKRDFAYAMLHAERLIQLLADEAICEILLEQSDKHPERREILERYVERAEPRARYQHDMIVGTGQRLLDRLRGVEPDAEEASA